MRPYKELVVVVGMGPASFSYLVTEAQAGNLQGKRVIVLEKGKSLVEGNLRNKSEVNFGMGGAGTFSDGKMVASTTVGGTLPGLTEEEYFALADEALQMMYKFYPYYDFAFDWTEPEAFPLPEEAGLVWNPTKVCHLGTERSRLIVTQIEHYLREFPEIEFQFETEVISIDPHGREIEVRYKYLNPSPDKMGQVYTHGLVYADKVINSAPNLLAGTSIREVHLGFRTESSDYKRYAEMISHNYDFKLSKQFENVRVRTFCACSNGAKVTPQQNGGKYLSWNGHGLANGSHEKVNYGILATYETTETVEEIEAQMAQIAKWYSNNPYPLREIFTPNFQRLYSHVWEEIREFVLALDKVVNITDEQIYLPEVEIVQKGVAVKRNYEMVDLPNVYIIGTASGYARSIIQAIITGILASKEASK